MKKLLLTLLLGISIIACKSSKTSFCGVLYGSKKEILKYESNTILFNFLDPKPNEKIADIGAGGMQWEAQMMVLRDSLTFYCEDVNTSCNNEQQLKKVFENVNKLRGGQSSGKIIQVLGTKYSTGLETSFFDKVLIINTFHEFSQRDTMVSEIYRILKTGGKVYIDERLPEKNKTIHQGCKKPMIGEVELIELMEKNGFKLIDKKMMKYTFPDQVYCFKKV